MNWDTAPLLLLINIIAAGLAAFYGYAAGQRDERERVLGYFYTVITRGLLSPTAKSIYRRIDGDTDDDAFHQELRELSASRRAETKP